MVMEFIPLEKSRFMIILRLLSSGGDEFCEEYIYKGVQFDANTITLDGSKRSELIINSLGVL
jgi:hypothetical protein